MPEQTSSQSVEDAVEALVGPLDFVYRLLNPAADAAAETIPVLINALIEAIRGEQAALIAQLRRERGLLYDSAEKRADGWRAAETALRLVAVYRPEFDDFVAQGGSVGTNKLSPHYDAIVRAALGERRVVVDGEQDQVGSNESEWEERANRAGARAERYARELTVLERVRDTGLLAATKVIAPNMPAWRAFTDALAAATELVGDGNA